MENCYIFEWFVFLFEIQDDINPFRMDIKYTIFINFLISGSWKGYGMLHDSPCCGSTKAGFTEKSEGPINYTNPGYGLSLVDTLWNAGSYRQPLEQEGNPMT